MLGIPQRRKKRVVAGEIEAFAQRRDGAKHQQRRAGPVHEGERRVLQREQKRREHHGAAQADGRNDEQDQRPERETHHANAGDRQKDHGGRDAGLQQEDAEEDAGDAPRELMQRGMRRQPVDMRIGEELHMRRRRICRVCRGRA